MTTPFTTVLDHTHLKMLQPRSPRCQGPLSTSITNSPPKIRQTATTLGATTLLLLSLSSSPALAATIRDPQTIFTTTCAGCHAAGGNIVRPTATLQLADLEKYGIADTAALYDIVYSGKNSMPGYGTNCAPKGACTFGARMTDEEVEGVAKYVLQQAKNGWKAGE